tara:strand:- start:6679 stop:6861 length:183 start_codon:yes stop_codon:yes gene_type:complete
MKFKETIKLIKNALKQKHLYNPTEIYYMKAALKEAKKGLKLKRSVKAFKKHESKISNTDS